MGKKEKKGKKEEDKKKGKKEKKSSREALEKVAEQVEDVPSNAKEPKKEKKEKKRSREALEKATEQVDDAPSNAKKSKKEKKEKQKKEKSSKEVAPGLESHPLEGDLNATDEDEEDPGTAAKAFQRVKADEWIGRKGSWDNSYEGTFGQAGWGFKAQQILGKVRGKDFRHEKTKKKRGSYRGGLIDSNAVCSYKFESDDE